MEDTYSRAASPAGSFRNLRKADSCSTFRSDSPIYPTQYPLAPAASLRYQPQTAPSIHSETLQDSFSNSSNQSYQPPVFRSFRERKQEKERQLALAAIRPETTADATSDSPRSLAGSPVTELSVRPGSSNSRVPLVSDKIALPEVGVPLAPENLQFNGSEGTTATSGSVSRRALPRPLPLPLRAPSVPSDSWKDEKASSFLKNRTYSDHTISDSRTDKSQAAVFERTNSDEPAHHRARPLPKPSNHRSNPGTVFSQYSPPVVPTTSRQGDASPTFTTPLVGRELGMFDRSDTISSIKSLNRYRNKNDSRPLPAPPVAVGVSRSLDRGIPTTKDTRPAPRALQQRRIPGSVERSHPIPEIREQPDQATTSLPIINFNDENDNALDGNSTDQGAETERVLPKRPGQPSSSSRGFSFSTIPTISVESSVAEDRPSIAIPVPMISLPDDPSSPVIIVPNIQLPAEDTSATPVKSSSTKYEAHTGPGIFCANCSGVIIGQIVTAMGRRWHPACFQCTVCHTLLEHVSSYEHDGAAYCHMDYHDLFAPKCHYCETAIVDSRFITIDDPTLGQRYYHELHFFCGECGDPFLDPSQSSAAGTEFAKVNDVGGDDLTKEFVIHGKHAFCPECHVKLHKPKCVACRKPIRDEALGALGGKWHKECFCCVGCDEPFPTSAFFPVDGQPYCQDCYSKSTTETE